MGGERIKVIVMMIMIHTLHSKKMIMMAISWLCNEKDGDERHLMSVAKNMIMIGHSLSMAASWGCDHMHIWRFHGGIAIT